MLTSFNQIAKHCNLDPSNMRRIYFNEKHPKNLNRGICMDRGTYLALHDVTDEELVLAVASIQTAKQHISSKIKGVF